MTPIDDELITAIDFDGQRYFGIVVVPGRMLLILGVGQYNGMVVLFACNNDQHPFFRGSVIGCCWMV